MLCINSHSFKDSSASVSGGGQLQMNGLRILQTGCRHITGTPLQAGQPPPWQPRAEAISGGGGEIVNSIPLLNGIHQRRGASIQGGRLGALKHVKSETIESLGVK